MAGIIYGTFDFNENSDADPDWDSYDYEPLTEEEINFGSAVYSFLQELIDADSCINYDYLLRGAIKKRYEAHCLCGENRVSDCNNIYYGFKNIDKYRIYENKVAEKVLDSESIIRSLCDKEYVEKCFNRLLCGNVTLYFPTCCCFRNNRGSVSIGLHPSAFNVTKNHDGNTVDLIVFAGKNRKTVTMRAIDASNFEAKFNSRIKMFVHTDVT